MDGWTPGSDAGSRFGTRLPTLGAGAIGIVLTALAAALALALAWACLRAWPGAGTVPVDRALLVPVLAGASALAAWLAVVLGRATAHVRAADEAEGAGHLPRSIQVACALLVTLAGLGAVPAQASVPVLTSPAAGSAQIGVPPGGDALGRRDDRPVPQPGWTPTPRVSTPLASGQVGLVSTAPRESMPDHVVVQAGDTLWGIAARHLGGGATTTDIAEEWPRWYAANRDLIGPDPDLILPGQELVVPTRELDR